MKGVSMVTLTAGGIIKKVTPAVQMGKRKRPPADLDSDDEGDSDDLYDDDDDDDEEDGEIPTGIGGNAGPVNNGDKKKEDRDYRPPRKVLDQTDSSGADDSMNTSDSKLNTSKRQRKE